MIHDVLVAKITGRDIPGDEDNALFKWMSEPISKENLQRHIDARKFLGIGHVIVFPIETFQDIGKSEHGNPLVRDIWGAVLERTKESTVIVRKPVETAEELDSYEFPDIDAFDFHNVTAWVNAGDFFVMPQIDTGYFKAHQLMGFEEYMNYLFTEPERIHSFMKRFTEFQKRLADKLVSLGVDGINLSDDVAFNSGPFISPKHLQEFDFDYTAQVADHIHAKGLPVMVHSCGNVNSVIERIIDLGADALHALQPSAHNDIFEYKEKYGDKICLIGNMDINYLLPNGSPCDIAGVIDEMARKLFYDKTGFVLSTCNMLNIDVPVENAISMHLYAEKF
jgi:uroporphyrinogen decarboxylase